MEPFEDDPAGSGTSIAAPLIRALLAAAIAFGVYWLVFAADDPAEDVGVAPATPTVAATVPASPTELSATTPPPLTATTPPPINETEPAGFSGVGLSVQVLNGTDDAELLSDAVQTLTDLGFDEVIDSGRSVNDYAETTLFYSSGQDANANSLQAEDPRFSVVSPNDRGLDESIELHVVVGADWTVGAAGTSDSDAADPTETPTE